MQGKNIIQTTTIVVSSAECVLSAFECVKRM